MQTAKIGAVLILEDEALVAMMMEDVLREMGAERVDICVDLDSALAAVEADTYHCAILDVMVHGKTSTGVADRLETLGVPFIFATGTGPDGLAPRHREHRLLSKPFSDDDLKACVTAVTNPAGGTPEPKRLTSA